MYENYARAELLRNIKMGAETYLKTGKVDEDLETAVEEVNETMSLEKLLSLILMASHISTVKDEVEKYIAAEEKVWAYIRRQESIAAENRDDARRDEESDKD